ncbi:MAG: GIY-YIG nuclease family protein [Patescibacteria group bacterium]
MFWVYALKSVVRNYIYVGLSSNVERRLREHNSGKLRTSKPYRPFNLIYKKEFATRAEARDEEKRLKTGSGKEFLKSL